MSIFYWMTVIIFLIVFPNIAHANFEWPALFDVSGFVSIWLILFSLCIEYMAIKQITKLNIQRSVIVCLIVNVASFLVGLLIYNLQWSPGFIIFLAQMGWAQTLWIPIAFLAAVVNLIIEWLPIRYVFKVPLATNQIFMLYLLNLLTVGLSFGYGQINPMTI
jgi:hypothetical protein